MVDPIDGAPSDGDYLWCRYVEKIPSDVGINTRLLWFLEMKKDIDNDRPELKSGAILWK